MNSDKLVEWLKNALRQALYTLGWVSGRLMHQDTQTEDQNTLSKLIVLQGGIENRFIPSLTEATKIQIEGSFKITGDRELQRLSMTDSSAIVLDHEDRLLQDVIENAQSVKVTLEVL